MAEWSKALDSSSSLFGGVGSNPTSTTSFFVENCFCFQDRGRAKMVTCARTVASSRLAQSVERKTFNLVVVGSSPTVGVF